MKNALPAGLAGLALMLAPASLTAQPSANAESDPIEYPPVYRVEVVVFAHVDGRSDRIRSEAPVDFTGRLDPLLLARANDIAERQLAGLGSLLPVAGIPGETDESTPWLKTEEQALRPIPPVHAALGELSRPIRRALDRLIDAPDYDPVTARAWIQLAQRGRPTADVRIHDQEVVEVIEPQEEGEQSLIPAAHVLPFGPLIKTPPPALEIYRLDGTVRLRQRQFLHMDLDLVWQTRARALAGHMNAVGESGPVPQENTRSGGAWQLHRLQQSRIVEPGRMEYFDSSLFGVLVWIERFEQVVPVVDEPEPDATDPDSVSTDDPVTNSSR